MKKLLPILTLLCYINSPAQVITTCAGMSSVGYNGDGIAATSALLNYAPTISIDECGNVYIGDAGNHRVRRVDAVTGIISTVAGTGVLGFSGDGFPATSANLNLPTCTAFDHLGNLYIGDGNNNRIRKVDVNTNVITTIIGGDFGFAGDGGPATAALAHVGYFCFAHSGDLYMCDTHRIRKIDTFGIITTVIGNGHRGSVINGVSAATDTIGNPLSICTDKYDNIFFVNSDGSIYKVDKNTNIINRVAGLGTVIGPYSGDGTPATACYMNPFSIFIDDTGNIYTANNSNNLCVKIDTFGITHLIAGTGIIGFSGDGGPATAAKLWAPRDLKLDNFGHMYISDWENDRIRKVTYPFTKPIASISLAGISSASVGSTVTVNATVSGVGSKYVIDWMNHGIEFSTTTTPFITYIKSSGIDTITAKLVPFCSQYDSAVSINYIVKEGNDQYVSSIIGCAELSIYPNPAHDEVNVIAANKITGITITNLLGQQMSSLQYNSAAVRVDVRWLPAGVYFMKVTDEDGVQTVERVIKSEP